MNESPPTSSTRLGLGILVAIGLIALGSIGLALTWVSSQQEEVPERIVRRKPAAPPPAPAPTRPFSPDEPATPPSSEDLPEFGEYVYIEDLPEALTKVPPEYPEAARNRGIQGTVVVQALIGKDGRVKETKVVRSVPELDEAAETAVRQWTFKPAKSYGKPVAVWVAVPVKFTLR